MIEADSNAMDVKRDLLNQRMKERHQQREMEISRCFESKEGWQTLQFNLHYFSEMSAHRKKVLKNWCLFSTKI